MEIFDVYDRNGILTGTTKTREDDFLKGEYLLGASLWIINRAGELLIQKRSPYKRIHPGKWSITGGGVLAGETSVQGCIRETREEIGLLLTEYEVSFLCRSFGEKIIFDDFITLRDFPIETAILQAEEVSDLKWATLQEIRELFDAGEFMFDDIGELKKVEDYIRVNIGS